MSISSLIQHIRPLRVGLASLALFLVFMAQPSGTSVGHEGRELITTAIIPSLVPIMLFVLMLDALMAKVWQSGASDDETKRLKTIVWLNFALLAALVLSWLPFFSGLVV